jgi:UTP:GlnB (protein PII) uridylyltransferase
MSQTILDLSNCQRRAPDQCDARTTNPLVENSWRERLIREAAYFRSQHRHPGPGKELDDWLAAEQEIERRLHASAP